MTEAVRRTMSHELESSRGQWLFRWRPHASVCSVATFFFAYAKREMRFLAAGLARHAKAVAPLQ